MKLEGDIQIIRVFARLRYPAPEDTVKPRFDRYPGIPFQISANTSGQRQAIDRILFTSALLQVSALACCNPQSHAD